MRVRELVAWETLPCCFDIRRPTVSLVCPSNNTAVSYRSFSLKARAPILTVSGSVLLNGGRVGTAPLGRYIDGIAQRHAVVVLCHGGEEQQRRWGRLMWEDCERANQIATRSRIKGMAGKKRMGCIVMWGSC